MGSNSLNSKKSEFLVSTPGVNSLNFLIPSYIFQDRRLTPLEALIKNLREKRRLSYAKIAALIKRNVRDIYKAYAHAFDKSCLEMPLTPQAYVFIPISIFSDRNLSALEAAVLYLKSQDFSFHEISVILSRNERTIWTVYKRASKKNDG